MFRHRLERRSRQFIAALGFALLPLLATDAAGQGKDAPSLTNPELRKPLAADGRGRVPDVKPRVKNQPAVQPAQTSISPEELSRLRAAEEQLVGWRDRYTLLENEFQLLRAQLNAGQSSSAPSPGPAAPSGDQARARRFFEQLADQFAKSVQSGIFCSAASGVVDDQLNLHIKGAVRDPEDVEKASKILEQNSFYVLVRSAGLVREDFLPDGGVKGGCTLPLERGSRFNVTRETKDSFRVISHAALTKEDQLITLIPDIKQCLEIGRLLASLREDTESVPHRQKVLFSTFWVKSANQLTLCREDAEEWQPAPLYRVKAGWEALLVLSRKGP